MSGWNLPARILPGNKSYVPPRNSASNSRPSSAGSVASVGSGPNVSRKFVVGAPAGALKGQVVEVGGKKITMRKNRKASRKASRKSRKANRKNRKNTRKNRKANRKQ